MVRKAARSLVVACAFVMLVVGLPSMAVAQTTPAPTPPPDPTAPFFNDTIVHDIYFTINTKDWNTLKTNYLDNTYYPIDFKWGTTTVRNAGIRSRGTGSRSGAKPGLRLDFDRYMANQNFLGLKSVVLRNSTQDPTNMHERLAMLFFQRMGLAAPREVYARLYVNNIYNGLYVVVESIDKTYVGKTFGNDQGYLYKYDYNVTDLPYYFTYRTSAGSDYVPTPFKAETHETDPRADVIERWAWTINNATDATFVQAISAFIDIPEFIRHVATEIYIADNDGFLGNWGMNNYYLYRLPDSQQFRFIDWDKSEAFKDTADYWIWHNHLDVPEPQRNRLWTRLMAVPEYKQYFLAVLQECIAIANAVPATNPPGDTRGWMQLEIERQAAQITPAVLQDANKPYSNEQFYAALDYLRQFVRDRASRVNDQVATSP
jgi:spore coat protein H